MGLFDKAIDKKVEEAKQEVNDAVDTAAKTAKPYFLVCLLMLGSYYAGKASALETILSNGKIVKLF